MAGNSFGSSFKITSFGESHGPLIGVVIDGCPAGLALDLPFIQSQLDRRKPGQSALTTQRKESDKVQFVSGTLDGITLGTPLAAVIKNEDAKSEDYSTIKNSFRPSHADFTYQQKYGIRDYRGGGRSSARETAARVVAGAVAELILKTEKVRIVAYVSGIGTLRMDNTLEKVSRFEVDQSLVRCPNKSLSSQMEQKVEEAKRDGDSLGGIITCYIENCPIGLGEPVFDRLQADLAKAMLSINAVKGFEYGSGFEGSTWRGSQHNDEFVVKNGRIETSTNRSGGIQGGISNGMDIYFNVAFKPTATILKPQSTLNEKGESITQQVQGRHDPCVVPRAVPIVESMAALVIADHFLRQKSARI